MVTGLGKQKIILGFSWLQEANPDINWQNGHINWRTEQTDKRTNGPIRIQRASIKDEPSGEEWKNQTTNPIENTEHILDDSDDENS